LQSLVALWQFCAQKSVGLVWLAESPLSPNFDAVAKILVGEEKIIRAYGLVPHPNILAAILVVALIGLAWLFLKEKILAWRGQELKTGLWLVSFFIISAALFFTFSRGVIVVGFVALFFWLGYVWLKNKEYRKPILIFILLLFAYSLLFIAAYWSHLAAHYNIEGFLDSQSVDLRGFYNAVAMENIASFPLLGVGQGNFVWALMQVVEIDFWMYQPVHNSYLLLGVEAGVPALLAFLAFLLLTLRDSWQQKYKLGISSILFIVVCLLLIGLFDHFLWDIQQGQILFWLMLGLLSSRSSLLRSNCI